MIIKCVICKTEFEQKNEERKCDDCKYTKNKSILQKEGYTNFSKKNNIKSIIKKYNISKKSINFAIKSVKNEIESGVNAKTLKETYLELMNQLLKDGIKRDQISTIGSKILIQERKKMRKKLDKTTNNELDKINPGAWWYEIAREHDFINSHYSHPKIPEPEISKEKLLKCTKCQNLVNDCIVFQRRKTFGWSVHCQGLFHFILCCDCNMLLKDFLMKKMQL